MTDYIISDDIDNGYSAVVAGVLKGELIRCKDCKHNKNAKWVDCPIKEFFGRTLDNYCSLAERRTE